LTTTWKNNIINNMFIPQKTRINLYNTLAHQALL
jgi:hypothetical protein